MPSRRDRQVRSNAPRPVEPIVGRDLAVAQLAQTLQGSHRVVTLTGPVGVGKSRLAWAVAEHLCRSGAFEDVLFCDLDGIDTAEGFEDALDRSVGRTGRHARAPSRSLDSLGQVLVVCDGADGLDPRLISETLAAAPSMTCLVTCRRVMGFAEGVVHELGPLDVPEGEALAGEAVAYFLSCVERVRPEYVPMGAEAPFVAELVRELDGLPLALQLAAPRLAVMGPAVLLHRLRTSRSSLRAGDATPHTHRSFDTAMGSAWQALSDEERDVLTQLTTFSGSWTVEAAERVVRSPATPVVDVLMALRHRSLLCAQTEEGGAVRLRMLRGVRNYVLRHGEPHALREARGRHAEHYAQEADRRAGEACTPSGREARAWLTAEKDNLLQVIRGVTTGEHVTARAAEPALRVVIALGPMHRDMTTGGELDALLERSLEATKDSGADPMLYARALVLRGSLRRSKGALQTALRDLMHALRVAQTLGSREVQGKVLIEIGWVLLARGEFDAAEGHFRQALEAFRNTGALAEEAASWQALGELRARRGWLEEAASLMDRAIALLVRSGDPQAEAAARCMLARVGIHAQDVALVESQMTALRALPLSPQDPARLETDLLDAIVKHDTSEEPDPSPYVPVEATARKHGLAGLEADALAFQAVARAHVGTFGQAHALLRSAVATQALRREALWTSIGGAIDARVSPSALPPLPAPPSADDPDAPIAEAFRHVASDPSRWTEVKQNLAEQAERDVVVRLALRALDRTSNAAHPRPVPAHALVVGGGGRWFRMPGEPVVSLERRRPLALLLDRLAAVRCEAREAALAWDILQEAGWPGERILAEAGAHRVRVAISTLRKLGLRDALETTPEGYRLASSLVVVRAEGDGV
jgi:predicted ATPase